MRRVFMLAVALALAAGSVPAFGAPGNAYVGLLADEAHAAMSIYPPALTPFDVWVWWLPSARGMMAATYNIVIPADVIMTATAANPDVQPALGCVGYFCAVFTSCKTDWVWTHRLTCMVMPAGFNVPAVIRIAPAPGSPAVEYASCEPGYPLEPVILFTNLNLYWWDAAEPATWGAIKGLFK